MARIDVVHLCMCILVVAVIILGALATYGVWPS
jgi:hypothetical protein